MPRIPLFVAVSGTRPHGVSLMCLVTADGMETTLFENWFESTLKRIFSSYWGRK